MVKNRLNENYERGYTEHLTCSKTNKERFNHVRDEIAKDNNKIKVTDNMVFNELLDFWEQN